MLGNSRMRPLRHEWGFPIVNHAQLEIDPGRSRKADLQLVDASKCSRKAPPNNEFPILQWRVEEHHTCEDLLGFDSGQRRTSAEMNPMPKS
jgi:hypothetical protein